MDVDRLQDGVVSLREITALTVREICALDVGPEQRGFVAPNAVSVMEMPLRTAPPA